MVNWREIKFEQSSLVFHWIERRSTQDMIEWRIQNLKVEGVIMYLPLTTKDITQTQHCVYI